MKYKLLGRSGLKVSELCLGTISFGMEDDWGADKETSFKIMDAFAGAGGNFLNTANIYNTGNNEKIIGEFLSNHNRDYFVLATKYSLMNKTNSNASVNNHTNLIRSVEESLKRLQTDFIDVLYLHISDHLTPIDEALYAMNDLIKQGKILYAAISDTPAWIVSRGNTMAELMGWNQFVALQIEYNLLQRTPERDLIPMAKHFNISITPSVPFGASALTEKYLRGEKGRIKADGKRMKDTGSHIIKEVIAVAEKLDVQPSHVALKWTMQQPFSVIPIVSAAKEQQLKENLKVTDITIPEEDMDYLDKISAIDFDSPDKFLREETARKKNYSGVYEKIEIQ